MCIETRKKERRDQKNIKFNKRKYFNKNIKILNRRNYKNIIIKEINNKMLYNGR